MKLTRFLNPCINVWITIITFYLLGWILSNSLFYRFGEILLVFKALDLVLDIVISIWINIRGKLHD